MTHAPSASSASPPASDEKDPWPALFALCLGFFMILVDSTIVSVATPAIIEELHAEVNAVVWVTSAYLLAYAVPVLITGRLGDRFGPKRLYLAGLTVFTLASLWCGLTNSIEGLILARVVQGLGASMITPQTMAIITRIFPAQRRGAAMALWGATAGVATLVGPILGGVLVDGLGWEWIFFINVPVGLVGFALAWRLVPRLETHQHSFDWLGVALSGVGMFLLVFGIQEGHQYHWGQITGPIYVWALIIAGLLVLALFLWWQSVNTREPLVPLGLFRDRNFSLANVAITVMGFAITAMAFPIMLYAQVVRGLSPTRAALLLVPMAVMSIVLAPIVGRLTDRVHPRLITGVGFACIITSLVWLSQVMTPDSAIWELLLPDGAARHRQRRGLGAQQRHRHPQPAGPPGRGGGRRLQRHPPGRRRARLGRDRRAHGRPAVRQRPPVGRLGQRRRRRAARAAQGRRSATRCRPRCCSRRWCSCSAWSRCCSSSARATPAGPRPPPPTAPVRRPRRGNPGQGSAGRCSRPRGRAQASECPVERRFSHASTTRSAMPFSAALPQARGS